MYYGLYVTSSAASSTLILTPDMDVFTNLLYANTPLYTNFSIKNIIYTILLYLSGNGFFSYAWTSFTIFAICIFLIYKITNLYKESNCFGLIAVLIFTTIPNMLLSVFGINTHMSEGMCLFFIIFFYIKSRSFENKYYSLLYLFFTLISFGERNSITIYISIIVLLTSYFSFKKQKYSFLIYNTIILAGIASILLNKTNHSYFFSKLDHWFVYLYVLDFPMMLKLPFLIIKTFFLELIKHLSIPYLILFLSSYIYRFKEKDTTIKKSQAFIDFMLMIIFVLYLSVLVPNIEVLYSGKFNLETAIFDDIFPVYAFIAIIIANFFTLCKNNKKHKYIFICLVAIGSLRVVDYGIPAFKETEKQYIETKHRYTDIYQQIAVNFSAMTKIFPNNDLLFAFEALPQKNIEPVETINQDYSSLPEIIDSKIQKKLSFQEYEIEAFMPRVQDMVLLNGMNYVFITDALIDSISEGLKIPRNRIYNVLTCDMDEKHPPTNFALIKTWKFRIDNNPVKLHLFTIKQQINFKKAK